MSYDNHGAVLEGFLDKFLDLLLSFQVDCSRIYSLAGCSSPAARLDLLRRNLASPANGSVTLYALRMSGLCYADSVVIMSLKTVKYFSTITCIEYFKNGVRARTIVSDPELGG